MMMEPHPWSKTAKGGKKMQRRTRRQDIGDKGAKMKSEE